MLRKRRTKHCCCPAWHSPDTMRFVSRETFRCGTKSIAVDSERHLSMQQCGLLRVKQLGISKAVVVECFT